MTQRSAAYWAGYHTVRQDYRQDSEGGSCGAGFVWVRDRRAEKGGYCRRLKGRTGDRIKGAAKTGLAVIGGLNVAGAVAGGVALHAMRKQMEREGTDH